VTNECTGASGLLPTTRRRRNRTGGLHQLVERQIEQIALPLAIDQHLAGIRIDLLHGVEIHATARHFRRLGVFGIDLREAARITLGRGDDTLLVTLGLLEQARGRTAGSSG
jgi:hypothetical protein